MRRIIIGLILLPIIAVAQPASSSAHYGPTTKSDHLWRIAKAVRPNKTVTIQQTMVALLSQNPSAFIKHNVNGLKLGYTLRLPTISKINSMSASAALRDIKHQNRQWATRSARRHMVSLNQLPRRKQSVPAAQPIRLAAASNMTAKSRTDVPFQYVQTQRDLRSRLQAAVDNAEQFKQQYNAQSAHMEGQIVSLQAQILKINKDLAELTNTVIGRQQAALHNESTRPTKVGGVLQGLNVSQLLKKAQMNLAIGVTALILLLLVWFFWPSKSEIVLTDKNTTTYTEDGADADLEDEYDFIGSKEGIPAKLDLARAYINMDDHKAARQVLEEVIAKGSADQKQQAQSLLDEMRIKD